MSDGPQLSLRFDRPGWGGARVGAGRKPGNRRTVPHRVRPVHRRYHPVHVTLRAREGLPRFRERAIFEEMKAAIRAASRSPAVGAGERFHARELRTPREVRDALVYVLMNAKKHGARVVAVDACSSAPWFDGFAARIAHPAEESPVVAPRTWLGVHGWRRRGLVRFDERPCAPG